MHTLCQHLNLGINPLQDYFNIKSISQYHSKIDLEHFNPIFLKLLDAVDLKIKNAPVFYTRPLQHTVIHSDGNGVNQNFIKLNFVFNEENSVMVWYKPLVTKSETQTTVINTPYISYQEHEAEEIHRQSLNGCSLVQVAVPHRVLAFDNPRYAITLTLWKKENDTAVTMEEGLKIFKQYLV